MIHIDMLHNIYWGLS